MADRNDISSVPDEARNPAEQAVIDAALASLKKAERELNAAHFARRVDRAYNDLVASDTGSDESEEDRYFLALASILRWIERHRLTPVERLAAIKTVAEIALDRTKRGY